MEEIIKILKEVVPNIDVNNEDFIANGILTSFSIMQLVVALDDEFDIEITPVDIIPENFKSAEAIYNMVQKLGD